MLVAEGEEMTVFELVKIVLDQSYAECEDLYGSDLDDRIAGEIQRLSELYPHLGAQSESKLITISLLRE
jgi:hypothetical protein